MAGREGLLSEAERQAVGDAIAEAERGTAGEIYCVAAQSSADYREVPLAYAALAALVAPLAAVALGWTPHWPFDRWAVQAERWRLAEAISAYAAVQSLLFAGVAALVAAPPIRRALTPRGLKRARVRRAAVEQFLAKGVHRTEARTGVLIYASLTEHAVEVVADETIHRRAPADAWAEPAAALATALRAGKPGEGFVKAVGLCGAVLAEHFPAQPGDRNELPDRIAEI